MRLARMAVLAAGVVALGIVVLLFMMSRSDEPDEYVRERAIDSPFAICHEAGGWVRVHNERATEDSPAVRFMFCDLPPRHPGIIDPGPEDFWIADLPLSGAPMDSQSERGPEEGIWPHDWRLPDER